MQHSSELALALHNYYDLLAVWEFNGRDWKLITMARLIRALALCRAKPHIRLIFPTQINPNRTLSSVGSLELSHTDKDLLIEHISNTELVEGLVNENPGINIISLATKLDVTTTTIRKHLKKLELQGKIHYRLSRVDGRKLYYPGKEAPTDSRKTQTKRCFRPKASSLPFVKVYYVDPRTLK